MSRLLVVFVGLSAAFAADVRITPDHADGTYGLGESITWTIHGGNATSGVRYQVVAEGAKSVAKGALVSENGTAQVTALLDRPGTMVLRLGGEGGTPALGGAAVAWRDIDAVVTEPEDFAAFWRGRVAELQAIPADPQLESLPSGDPQVSLWKITLANIRGTRVQGYLARPVGVAPCPALVQFQWAGVYALNPASVTGPAKQGWMALNIMAHDLPPDRSPAFYQEQGDGPLKDYALQGGQDRDTSYFLRLYLGCARAATYLRDRPDWNHRTLLATGKSQGGLQAVVAAALVPEVTLVTALVPAGCDQRGPEQGRAMGWPYWLGRSAGAERAARATACGYYDAIHFASRIRCPALVGLGLIDTTCPSSGVFTLFHRLGGPKRLVIMPESGHKGPHDAYLPIAAAWQTAAKAGIPPSLE